MAKQQTLLGSSHRARKRFGQNFLVDNMVIDSILEAINAQPAEQLVEIGPGQGAITHGLLASGAQLTAIEIDRDLIGELSKKFMQVNNFTLLNQDALQVDYRQLQMAKDKPLRIVGNLPYNISTPLLLCLLKYCDCIEDMYFMLQKEVVDRLSASPNSSQWGRLSIMIQYHAEVESLMSVPASAFLPQPKVESAVVRIRPKPPENAVIDMQQFTQLVKQAFSQRRKTIRNTLKGLVDQTQFQLLDIDPSLRPENLDLATYVKLSNYLSNALSDTTLQGL